MKTTLLKELNDMTREPNEFEDALREAEMEFDIDLSDDPEMDMDDDMEDPDEFDYDSVELDDEELQRIADYCEEECGDMDDEELMDKIGDDLEQLDYSPEEISAGIDRVMSMMGRGEGAEGDMDMDDGGFGGEDPEMDMDDDLGEEPRF